LPPTKYAGSTTAVDVVKQYGKVEILFNDDGFGLIDDAALLRVRWASSIWALQEDLTIYLFRN
jgi:hypothetical protein